MHKKITILLILSILLVGCVQEENPTTSTSQKTTTTIAQGMKEYIDYKQGFSLQYPAGWKTKENVEGSTVLFVSPEEDEFLENINVYVGKSKLSGSSLDELTQVMKNQVREKIGNDTEIQEAEAEIAGKKAKEITYAGKKQGRELKWKQAYTLVGEKIIIITYTAEKTDYEKEHSAYEKIKNSVSME